MDRQERLTEALVHFARTLVSAYSIGDILYELCDRVVEVLPVTGAGVMLTDEQGDLRFVSASDEAIRTIEALQIELGEGPCLHAYRTGNELVVSDLGSTDWFPHFGPAAMSAGLRAVYSFPMAMGDERIGALNLYNAEPGELTKEDVETGQILADVATMYVVNARALRESQTLAEQLQHALESRVVIEQAKGRVAEQLGVDVGRAFEQIRRHARHSGMRLSDVAAAVVSGELRLDPPEG